MALRDDQSAGRSGRGGLRRQTTSQHAAMRSHSQTSLIVNVIHDLLNRKFRRSDQKPVIHTHYLICFTHYQLFSESFLIILAVQVPINYIFNICKSSLVVEQSENVYLLS